MSEVVGSERRWVKNGFETLSFLLNAMIHVFLLTMGIFKHFEIFLGGKIVRFKTFIHKLLVHAILILLIMIKLP